MSDQSETIRRAMTVAINAEPGFTGEGLARGFYHPRVNRFRRGRAAEIE